MVCYRRLQLKLQAHGISGALLIWLTAFVVGRSFRIKLGIDFSDEFPIVRGVPQGSVLGPVVFLVFINDLPDSIRSVCRIFADDVKINPPNFRTGF